MKKIIFFFFFSLLLFVSWGQEVKCFSLQECVQYAEEHNFSLQSAALDVNSSELRLSQSKLAYAPRISATASQGFGYSHDRLVGGFSANGNYGISAGMTLFDGLNTPNTIKQNRLRLDQSALRLEQSKNQARISIIQAYLSILMNEERLASQRNVLISSREQFLQGEKQFRVGQILESDLILLEARYFSDSMNVNNTEIEIANNFLTLKNLLALPSSQALQIVTPDSAQLSELLFLPALNDLITQTFNYLPDLKIEEKNVAIADYDVKIAKSNYYPTLSLSASVSTGYRNNNGAFGDQLYDGLGENVGLNLNIPIYQQSSVRTNVKMKQIAHQQAQFDQQQKHLQVAKEIEEYYFAIQKLLNEYKVSEVQQKAYFANYLTYNQRFMHGAVTAVELLQQQTDYLNMLNQNIQNKYNYLLQRKILDVYMGVSIEL